MDSNNVNKIINNRTIIALIIGLILGFWAGTYFSAKQSPGDLLPELDQALLDVTPTGDQAAGLGSLDTNGDTLSPGSTEARVDVSDQVAGSVVILTSVTLPSRGWVAVRDSNNGALGSILGAKRLEAGVSANAVVELLRPTTLKTAYLITMYTDNGDGLFDSRTDVMIGSANKPLVFAFNTL